MKEAILKNLEERRSVRKYLAKQVDEESLKAILRAGTFAPTGRNLQSPVIVCVQNKETIEQLRKLNAAVLGDPEADPFYGAPTVVVVLADPNVSTWIEDGSLVIGNMMNAAHSLGVASCWIHRARQTFECDEGKALLRKWGIDERYSGVGNCILGYVDGELPQARERKEDYIYRV